MTIYIFVSPQHLIARNNTASDSQEMPRGSDSPQDNFSMTVFMKGGYGGDCGGVVICVMNILLRTKMV